MSIQTQSCQLSKPNPWAQSQLCHKCQTTGHNLDYNINAKHWARSQRLSMSNTGHNLNCSINAKHWSQSQQLSMPNTGQDLNYSVNAKPLGTIS